MGLSDWCGTTDPLDGLAFIATLPFMLLYLVGLFIYCKITRKAFLEDEKKELEEAERRPPIILE